MVPIVFDGETVSNGSLVAGTAVVVVGVVVAIPNNDTLLDVPDNEVESAADVMLDVDNVVSGSGNLQSDTDVTNDIDDSCEK